MPITSEFVTLGYPNPYFLVFFVAFTGVYCLFSLYKLLQKNNWKLVSVYTLGVLFLGFCLSLASIKIRNTANVDTVGWPMYFYHCGKWMEGTCSSDYSINNLIEHYFILNWLFYSGILGSIVFTYLNRKKK